MNNLDHFGRATSSMQEVAFDVNAEVNSQQKFVQQGQMPSAPHDSPPAWTSSAWTSSATPALSAAPLRPISWQTPTQPQQVPTQNRQEFNIATPRRALCAECGPAAKQRGRCEPCRHFLRGRCNRQKCGFCHHEEDRNTPHLSQSVDPWFRDGADPWQQQQHGTHRDPYFTYPTFECESGSDLQALDVQATSVYNHSATRLRGEEALLV